MLKLASLITPSAMVAALTLAAAPSFAQERYHGRQNPAGQGSSGQTQERAQPRSQAPRAQAEAPRAQAEAPRAQAEAPRPQAGAAPAVESRQTPRAQPPQRQAEQPRAENRRDPHPRGEIGRAVPRSEVIAPRGSSSPHYEPHYSPGYPTQGYQTQGYPLHGHSVPGYSPWAYAPRSYYRPYVFRPRYSIGFGIFSGYPVPYTYSYPYPIVVYGYRAPRERVMIAPGSPYYGGVALEMTPYDADVFVDGEYAGHVEDFDGTTQPLTLSAGPHQIEVQAQGYEPMRVFVEVQPGQVIPYRGDLRPY